jgi:hypothetical protein
LIYEPIFNGNGRIAGLSLLTLPWLWSDAVKTTEPSTAAAYKAIVLSAFVALLLLGFLMVFLTWLAGRITRRYINRPFSVAERATSKPTLEEAWAKTPLVTPIEEEPDSFSGE